MTQHLVILEKANPTATVWRGREKPHYLGPVAIHEVYARWIAKCDYTWLRALHELKTSLEEQKNA